MKVWPPLRALILVTVVACGSPTAPTLPAPPAPRAPAVSPKEPEPPPPPRDCTDDGWCWENPLPHDTSSMALWGSARDDVWGVGAGGIIRRWTADGATRVRGLRKTNFYAVLGSRPDDIWAVGYLGAALHWDGATWSERGVDTTQQLIAIARGDDGGVWVVGDRGAIWQWDGARWTQRVASTCRYTGCSVPVLRSASGGAVADLPGDTYWDGAAQVRARPRPTGRSFGGAYESSIWLFHSKPERWDGRRWTVLAAPTSAELLDLWGTRDDDVWAVGEGGVVLRWNGSDWRLVESPTTSRLDEVWGSGADDVWISGVAGTFRWDGTRWTALSSTVAHASLDDVWGSDECAVWAVGARGTLLRRDCTGWSRVVSGVTEDLHGVGGSGPDDVWFVGDGGAILHFDGRRVSRIASPVSHALRSVWARSATDAWAVGDRGTIAHWNGRDWTEVPGLVGQALVRVRGAGESVFAIGHGVLLAWHGSQWSRVPGPPYCMGRDGAPDRLTGLAVHHRDDLWITCDWAGLLHWTGKDWELPGGQGKAISYHDVVGDSDDVIVVGWYGTVVRRRAKAWTVEESGTALPLRSAWRSPRGHTWIVGDGGIILSNVAAVPAARAE